MGKYINDFISEITCQKKEFANAKIEGKQEDTYAIDAVVKFQCDPGYEPETFLVTCKLKGINGEWEGGQQCKCKYQFIIIQQFQSNNLIGRAVFQNW